MKQNISQALKYFFNNTSMSKIHHHAVSVLGFVASIIVVSNPDLIHDFIFDDKKTFDFWKGFEYASRRFVH
jgi:hypothetical protein